MVVNIVREGEGEGGRSARRRRATRRRVLGGAAAVVVNTRTAGDAQDADAVEEGVELGRGLHGVGALVACRALRLHPQLAAVVQAAEVDLGAVRSDGRHQDIGTRAVAEIPLRFGSL
eukprot:COSAG01_NODE_34543_length_545_cov_129.031390_1_plen_116_part_10